jgi:hypothetical protein
LSDKLGLIGGALWHQRVTVASAPTVEANKDDGWKRSDVAIRIGVRVTATRARKKYAKLEA